MSFHYHGDGSGLLLIGEGSFLKIYDVKAARLICRWQIFESQIIHGIVSSLGGAPRNKADANQSGVILYGGRSYALLSGSTIHAVVVDGRNGQHIVPYQSDCEHYAPDWLLNANIQRESNRCLFVTAHAAILLCDSFSVPGQLSTLVPASPAIFYSAHIVWTNHNSFLLAAGSVFGEIELTQWENGVVLSSSTFIGHEGSIFGVCISDHISLDGIQTRLLASCSDDRTIRLWDLESEKRPDRPENHDDKRNTGLGEQSAQSNSLVANVMGHASRIWNVSFNKQSNISDPVRILSFGEDATCIQWLMSPQHAPDTSAQKESLMYTITNEQTFRFHEGKHIFSSAITISDVGDIFVATGGGDGGVTLHQLQPAGDFIAAETDSLTSLTTPNIKVWAMDELLKDLPPISEPISDSTYEQDIDFAVDNPPSVIETEPANDSIDLKDPKKKKKKPKKKKLLLETIRDHAFVSPKQLIVVTTSGKLLLDADDVWEEVPSCISSGCFSMVFGIPKCCAAIIVGVNGLLHLYRLSCGVGTPLDVPIRGKVADVLQVSSMETENVTLLVTFLGLETALVLSVPSQLLRNTASPDFTCNILVLPTRFIATAAALVKGHLIIGSRTGRLAIYDGNRNQDAIHVETPSKDGNIDAITSITALPVNATSREQKSFITTSRYGPYSIYYFSSSERNDPVLEAKLTNSLTLLHRTSLPLFMIDCMYLHDRSLYFTGFRGQSFVVWNETEQREVLDVPCGGGTHRSYVYQHTTSASNILTHIFAWTKSGLLHRYQQEGSSHTMVKAGGHGREIKACDRHPDLGLIATAAEDTMIKLFRYQNNDSDRQLETSETADLVCCGCIRKHTAGPQAVQFDKRYPEDDACYLYTSGGFEEFYIWRVVEIPGYNVGVRLEASLPEHLFSEDQDLRITAFDIRRTDSADPGYYARNIMLAYSDSTIKYLHYSSSKGFKLLATGQYTASSITHIETIHIGGKLILLTTSTDGYVSFWKIPDRMPANHDLHVAPELVLFSRHRHHQNAILACQIPQSLLGDEVLYVLTASDDNSITLASYSRDTLSMISQLTITSAHCAAITGLSLTINSLMYSGILRFWSVSIDQVLRRWAIDISDRSGRNMFVINDDKGSVHASKRINTADVGGLISWTDDQGDSVQWKERVLVFGAGMEILSA